MIPVRQCKDDLLIVFALVGRVWVMNNERSTETVRVLAGIMRVIPVCPRLIDLGDVRELQM